MKADELIVIQSLATGDPLPDFFTFVYKYHESMHSGVLSNLLRLDLQYPYSVQERTKALLEVAKYAHYSIMAYRAIQWWASQKEIFSTWVSEDGSTTIPIEMLKAIEKPKEYISMFSGMEKVPDEDPSNDWFNTI